LGKKKGVWAKKMVSVTFFRQKKGLSDLDSPLKNNVEVISFLLLSFSQQVSWRQVFSPQLSFSLA
jgi:hypothetical protein